MEPVESRTEFLMGTTCSLALYERTSKGVMDRMFERVKAIEGNMSFKHPDSEVSAINAKAGITPVAVSEDTFYVIRKALRYSAMTDGHFDITIGPLVDLWGIGTADEQVPTEEAVRKLLPLVDYRKVVLDESQRTVFLQEKGMKIDLGGIAKGYAADEAVAVLREEGVERAIVDFGGNIYTMGKKAEERPWRVGIQNPDGRRGSYIGIVEVTEAAVVSSGDYERYFERDGVRYHHILNTGSGYPVRNGVSSCTLVAESALQADALTTAIFSMGVEEGLAYIESLDTIEGAIVTDEDRVHLSSSLASEFRLTDSSFTVAGERETEKKEGSR
jgi:thiamine biosynthesis lipoprotein